MNTLKISLARFSTPPRILRPASQSVRTFVALAIVVLLASPTLALDTIRLADSQISGEIQSMTRDEVVIKAVSEANTRTIPVDQIVSISFSGGPPQMQTLVSQLELGNYAGIQRTLDLIATEKTTNARVKAEIGFISSFAMAQNALSGNGDLAEAGQNMKAYVDANPQHWRYYTAVQVLGELYSAVGADEDASKTFGLLRQAPSSEIKQNGTIAQAKALLSAEKYQDALPLFEEVLNAGGASPQSKSRAMVADVGRVACQAQLGQVGEGIETLRGIIDEGDAEETELFAMAYTALGNCYLADGKNQEALLAFLHVDLLYSAQARYRAEALYHLSRLWGEVGQGERALQARQTLLSSYADSVWARKSETP